MAKKFEFRKDDDHFISDLVIKKLSAKKYSKNWKFNATITQ